MFTSKCPLTFQTSQGPGPFLQTELLRTGRTAPRLDSSQTGSGQAGFSQKCSHQLCWYMFRQDWHMDRQAVQRLHSKCAVLSECVANQLQFKSNLATWTDASQRAGRWGGDSGPARAFADVAALSTGSSSSRFDLLSESIWVRCTGSGFLRRSMGANGRKRFPTKTCRKLALSLQKSPKITWCELYDVWCGLVWSVALDCDVCCWVAWQRIR